jgi:hypothetical protein
MTSYKLSPSSGNYVQCDAEFQQLTQFTIALNLTSGNATADVNPVIRLDGCGRAYLNGSINLTNATPTVGMSLFTLPSFLSIKQDYVLGCVKEHSGAFSNTVLQLTANASPISAVTVLTAGQYATIPSISTSGNGSGATFAAHMIPTLVTLASNPTGNSSYAPNDTITLAGGTFSTQGVIKVVTTGVYAATVASGGSGGTNGTQTVTGTTGTGVFFTANVTVTSGAISAVNSITTAGSYTVNPTVLTAEPVSGAGLIGATLNIHMKPLTFTTVAGNYTVLPTSPVSQTSSSGSGLGATFTVLWGFNSIVVTAGGTNYDANSLIVISGGGGNGGGSAQIILSPTSTQIVGSLGVAASQNDILNLDGIVFFVDSY